MAHREPYPFRTVDIIVVEFKGKRKVGIPQQEQTAFVARSKLIPVNEEGRLQLNVRLLTPDDSWLTVYIEAVALFDYLNDEDKTNEDLQLDFVNNQGLLLTWMQLRSFLRQLTVLMGIPPIDISVPERFSLRKEDLFPKPKDKATEETITE